MKIVVAIASLLKEVLKEDYAVEVITAGRWRIQSKTSIDYFKCVQHTGQRPETHHTIYPVP
jgi:hypothetical protein